MRTGRALKGRKTASGSTFTVQGYSLQYPSASTLPTAF